MSSVLRPEVRARRSRRAGSVILSLSLATVLLGSGSLAHATGLTINPTYDSSITGDANAGAIEGAIQNAINAVTGQISSPHNISVNIYFQEGGGLGSSNTGFYGVNYQDYYNQYAAVATQPNQLIALASLPNQTNNPVTGTPTMWITSAEARNLGFSGTLVS